MSTQNCHKMALISQIAYFDEKSAKKQFKNLGYTKVQFLDIDGAQAYVVSNKNEMTIAFRGTEPTQFSDIIADLNAFPDRGQVGGWVHNGFQEEVNKLWDDIVKIVKSKPKNKSLYITGHSLGGAMAIISASRIQDVVSSVYTYGAPRVGTKEFVSNCHFLHYRHVNNNDIVPTVPWAILGYRHHTKPRYINFYGDIKKLTPWQRFKDKIRGRWEALKKIQFFDSFYDHQMRLYTRYTEKNEDGNL